MGVGVQEVGEERIASGIPNGGNSTKRRELLRKGWEPGVNGTGSGRLRHPCLLCPHPTLLYL